MIHEITTGTILIKDDALLPKELQFKSEPCVPGWALVTDLDAGALNRAIQKTGWTFFCLAGEIRATVFGIDPQSMVRRAIERILVRAKSEKCNSLEITRVASVGSERFPLVRYLTVSAQSRHIQESLFLVRPNDLAGPDPRKDEVPSGSTAIASGKTPLSSKPANESAVVPSLSQLPEGDGQMRVMRKSWIFLTLILLATPVISGQDLSKYRKFALGTTMAALSKQIGQESRQANLIHASPVLIQELTYWPVQASYSASLTEPASQILFSFYNGVLYRIVVTYDQNATAGLTNEDMVQALSARYGTATRFDPEIDFPAHNAYEPAGKVVARWEDSENSVNLVHSGSLNTFGLAVFSKGLDTQVNAALAESARIDKEEAPQREIDRQKKEADDLDAVRQKNKKAFRP